VLTRKYGLSLLQGNYLILVLGVSIIYFVQTIPNTYFSLYVNALGGTALHIALIGSASTLITAVVMIFGGFFADHYGRRRIIILSSFGIALTYVLYAVASTWEILLVGVIINSALLIHQPALDSLTADSIAPSNRGLGFSLLTLVANLAMIPAPLLAGYLLEQSSGVDGFRLGYAIVVGGWTCVVLARLRLSETNRPRPQTAHWSETLGLLSQVLTGSIRVWKEVPSSMRYLFLSQSFESLFSGIFTYYLVLYGVDVLGISRVEFGVLSSIMFLVSVVSSLPIGKLIDVVGRKKPLMLSWILITTSMLFLIGGDVIRLVVSFIVYGFGSAMLNTAFPSLRADLVPRELRGKVIGSHRFMTMLLMSIGLIISGFLYDKVSPHLPFILYTLFTIPNSILIYFFVEDPQQREI
jgi:MFS family permease